MNGSPPPSVSVVIATYAIDRFTDLCDVLGSLTRQTRSDCEVICVVDSSDALRDSIEAVLQRIPLQSRLVFCPRRIGISLARNLGLEAAKAPIVAFLDDDVVAEPYWLDEVLRSFLSGDVVAATGGAGPLWVRERADWLPSELSWVVSCTDWFEGKDSADVRNVWGMNMAFRSEAIRRAGGFRGDLGGVQGLRRHGEEVELSYRVRVVTGGRILYNPRMFVYHKVYPERLSLKAVAATSYWMGFTRNQLRHVTRFCAPTEDFLRVERRLVTRMLTRATLQSFGRVFLGPIGALRALTTIAVSVGAALAGYVGYWMRHPDIAKSECSK